MDIKELIQGREGENYGLHRKYLNPLLARVLEIIGYDVVYTRGRGRGSTTRRGTATSISSPATACSTWGGATPW